VADFLGWNVTRALGPGLAAVRPDALRLDLSPGRGAAWGGGAGRAARVTGRTFRRDHWRIEVELATGGTLAVELRDPEPPAVGTPVEVLVDAGAVIQLLE
jgi:hypothetical protein